MAKQKVYSKDEDLMAIPLDQEVLVAIDQDDGSAVIDIDDGKKDSKPATTEVQDGDEDTVEKLNKQIEELRESNKLAQQQLVSEQKERRRAENTTHEIVQEAIQFRSAAERAHHNTLKSSLAASQAEQEAAKKEYAAYLEAGDFPNAAEAQQKMSRAAARVVQTERDLGSFETQQAEAEERAKSQPRQTSQQPVDVISSIDTDVRWLPKEKEFLKAHPELLTDPQKNAELGIAYNRAMSEKLSRGTPEYFAFIENFMGYKKSEPARKDDDDEEIANAAPVRRDNMSGRQPQRPSQVKLSPEQREMARNMGISETGYAKQFLKLQSEKQSNPEKYNQTRG